MKNLELVVNQAKEKIKENLKFTLYDGATVMDMKELREVVKEVCEEVLSFLDSDAKGSK